MSHGTLNAARAITVVALALLLPVAPVAAEERVTSFIAEVTLNADNSIDVVETLEVQVDGTTIKHGIFRNIDIGVRGADTLRSELTVTRIERDSSAEPYTIEPGSTFTTVRIGDAEVLIVPGPHTYVVGYHLTNVAVTQAGLDLLAWQVIGSWPFPIEAVQATVTLPPDSKLIGATGGIEGDTTGQSVMAESNEGKLQFTYDSTMEPGTTMWIHVLIAKGPLT